MTNALQHQSVTVLVARIAFQAGRWVQADDCSPANSSVPGTTTEVIIDLLTVLAAKIPSLATEERQAIAAALESIEHCTFAPWWKGVQLVLTQLRPSPA